MKRESLSTQNLKKFGYDGIGYHKITLPNILFMRCFHFIVVGKSTHHKRGADILNMNGVKGIIWNNKHYHREKPDLDRLAIVSALLVLVGDLLAFLAICLELEQAKLDGKNSYK